MKIKSAVILAAGMGTRLRSVTKNMIPKGFLIVDNEALIKRSINLLKSVGIEKIYIATGHLNEFYDELALNDKSIITKKNEAFSSTGSMASLAVLNDLIDEDFLVLESDLIYEKKALTSLLNYEEENCVLVSGKTNSGDELYVEIDNNNNLYKASKKIEEVDNIYGEWVGICKISKKLLKEMMNQYEKSTIAQYHYEDCLVDAAKSEEIICKKIDDLIWAEIDDESHLNRVETKIIPKLKVKGEI